MNKTILQRKFKTFCAFIIASLLVSCSGNDIYFQYHEVAAEGWNMDSTFIYDVNVADSSASYNVYINVRNRGEYPHQNLWLFVKKISQDSVVVTDTINFYLADQRGKWLGSGIGSVFEMPVLYQQGVRYPTAGKYRYELSQGMRDSILIGINDVGLRIEKVDAK